jgi:hypothetical protein
MEVDESGRDVAAVRLERRAAGLVDGPGRSNDCDPAVANADVGRSHGRAAAIEDGPTGDHEVEHV